MPLVELKDDYYEILEICTFDWGIAMLVHLDRWRIFNFEELKENPRTP
jgi:hypothetical protein